ELAGERLGRAAPQAAALEPDIAAVVGDQPGAAIDQPQREVRFALPRIAENQDAAIARRDAAGMDIDDLDSGPARKHGARLTGAEAVPQGDRMKVAPAKAAAAGEIAQS